MPRNPPQDEPGAYFEPEVRNANRLSLAFTKAVAAGAEDINDNVVVSPYNAMTFLTMAALGTKGNTRKEYADILFGTGANQLKAQAQKFASLNSSILKSNEGKVTLKTANALWVNSNTGKLDSTYKSELEGIFGAEVSDKDFGDENVVTEMNTWGSNATGGLIPKFIDSLESDDRSILAGAIYFKGEWTRKFDRKNTKDRDFHVDGQSDVVRTPTMHQEFKEGEVAYHRGDNYESIALTFGEKNYEKQPFKTPSMRIILIRPDDPSLTARDWLLAQDENVTPAWVDPASFRSALGTVELPHM
jgi:serine protease inhibitor